MLGGLIVDPARMAKNLGMTHGLIVAEAVMMGLAPHTGRNEAHDLVYDACRAAIESDRPLYDVLLETSEVAGPLGAERLRELTDPANYLGAAQAWSIAYWPGGRLHRERFLGSRASRPHAGGTAAIRRSHREMQHSWIAGLRPAMRAGRPRSGCYVRKRLRWARASGVAFCEAAAFSTIRL